MNEKDRENETVDELINESGSIGEEQLPQVDVGKSDKAPWNLMADKMKRKADASENGQERFPFGGGL
jgi:hypothetical protein